MNIITAILTNTRQIMYIAGWVVTIPAFVAYLITERKANKA